MRPGSGVGVGAGVGVGGRAGVGVRVAGRSELAEGERVPRECPHRSAGPSAPGPGRASQRAAGLGDPPRSSSHLAGAEGRGSQGRRGGGGGRAARQRRLPRGLGGRDGDGGDRHLASTSPSEITELAEPTALMQVAGGHLQWGRRGHTRRRHLAAWRPQHRPRGAAWRASPAGAQAAHDGRGGGRGHRGHPRGGRRATRAASSGARGRRRTSCTYGGGGASRGGRHLTPLGRALAAVGVAPRAAAAASEAGEGAGGGGGLGWPRGAGPGRCGHASARAPRARTA